MRWPTPQAPNESLLSPAFLFHWMFSFYNAFIRHDRNYEYFTEVTSDYLALETDTIIYCDCTSGDVEITLPNDIGYSKKYIIRKIDSGANNVTILTPGSVLALPINTLPITGQYKAVTVIFDGANWMGL